MPEPLSDLGEEFVKDHSWLARSLVRLQEALQQSDLQQIVQAADDLDRVAGPHMQFEEQVFYPEVEKVRGREFVGRLFHEHGIGLQMLKSILQREGTEPLSSRERDHLLRSVELTLEHVYSCGSLLSHLTELEQSRQTEMLDRLREFRRREKRWTELPPPHVDVPSENPGDS